MAKLSLASAPKTFKRTVSIPLLDGSDADIEITYKYKTRSDYAKLLDDVVKSEKPKDKQKEGEEVTESAVDIFKRLGAGTVDYLMKIIESWDLDDEFNKANIADLIDKFPSAANKISETYRIAILEGATKN